MGSKHRSSQCTWRILEDKLGGGFIFFCLRKWSNLSNIVQRGLKNTNELGYTTATRILWDVTQLDDVCFRRSLEKKHKSLDSKGLKCRGSLNYSSWVGGDVMIAQVFVESTINRHPGTRTPNQNPLVKTGDINLPISGRIKQMQICGNLGALFGLVLHHDHPGPWHVF